MKPDHTMVRPGCLLVPGSGTVAARLGLGLPCPTMLLVLGSAQLAGLRHVQVLITYPDGTCQVEHYRMKHLLECYEVCPDA